MVHSTPSFPVNALLRLITFAALVSCSHATAPVDFSGTWRMNFLDMTMGSLVCDVEAMDVVITRSGDAFTGTQTGITVRRCTHNNSTITSDVTGVTVVEGQIDGSHITFSLGSIPGSAVVAPNSVDATLSGSTISGTAIWPDNTGGMTVSGTFSATKLQ